MIADFFELDLYKKILLIAFIASFAVQMFYCFFFFYRLIANRSKSFEHGNNQQQSVLPPVSVIICARDEEENLRQFLPSILTQDYPEYEVVVVNDCSEDFTELVLDQFKKEYKHLRSTKINKDQKFGHGKKLALTIGIKAASKDWLVLSDADCQAQSKHWLTDLMLQKQEDTEIIIAYGGYFRRKGFVNLLVRTDAFYNALFYLNFGLAKKTYMGVGRNLAYKKELFFKNKGFASHYHLLSGDDDLFINEVSNKINTKVSVTKNSINRSVPSTSFSQWLMQKRRHLSTGNKYKVGSKFLLGLEGLSRFVFYLTFIVSMALQALPILVASFFGFRIVNQLIIYIFTAKKLNEKRVWLFSFVYDFLQLFLNAYLLLLNRLKPGYFKWK